MRVKRTQWGLAVSAKPGPFAVVSLDWTRSFSSVCIRSIIAGSLEAAYSLNWGAREIWGKGGGETLALL